MKKKDEKLTNKYVFTIQRLKERPLTWEETHGMAYRMNMGMYPDMEKKREGEMVIETLWSQEYEIKEEQVVDILKALLPKLDPK
jgi:hypothetical protein